MTHPAPPQPILRHRSGASLAVTLCALVLIECVILGTLHLALLERQLASSGAAALRLRMAADAALAVAAGGWDEAADRAHVRGADRVVWRGAAGTGIAGSVVMHPANSLTVLLRSEVWEESPGAGVASAAMLLLPPLLPPAYDPAVPLNAAATDSLIHRVLAGLAAGPAPGVRVLDDDAVIDGALAGVVVARGNLRLAHGAEVFGFVLAAGLLTIDDGASLTGAAVARYINAAGESFTEDPTAALAAAEAAGMRRLRPVPGRSRLPAF
jgi:hypothetical protein